MEYILSLLLLALNLIDYEHNINKAVFFAVGLVLFCTLFAFCFKKSKNFLAACLMMLCHTWQISWINIFGDPTTSLQLPWFYIIGVFVLFYAVLNARKLIKSQVGSVLLIVFVCAFILSVYPLFRSRSLSEGLKEYIMIGFFLVLVFIAALCSSTVPYESKKHIENAFMFAVVVTSAMLIFQYAYYSATGTAIFKFSVGQYFDETMSSAKLLMEDTSCSTIMLGCGVFYMLDRLNKKTWLLYGSMLLVTVIGLAFTTRRTSVISLVIVLVPYVFIHYKGTLKKTVMLLTVALTVGVMIAYLLVARPVDDLSQIINENGRMEYYINSLRVFFENPLGIGYDNLYLADAVGGYIPHNTVLRWLVMGGIPFAVPMVAVMLLTIRESYRKRFAGEFWIVLYTLFASNFIPDILNARFFVIPCMTVFLFSRAMPENSAISIQTEVSQDERSIDVSPRQQPESRL
ncbi:MAG: O-antigen ligase family protein [Candidatus Avispirillum sp.]